MCVCVCVCVCVCEGVRRVTVIAIGKVHGDPSSNPGLCISRSANTLGKCMDLTILSPDMGK